MSAGLSRAELEAMNHDELIDTILDLQSTVEDLELRVEALGNGLETANDEREAILKRLDDIEAENQRLRDDLADATATAQGAYKAANAGRHGDKSKCQLARDLTRNVLVQRAAGNSAAQDRKVTIAKVQELAEDGHGVDLKWQTVRDAWDSLQEDWPQFYETAKDGSQALSVRPSNVTPALAKAVQADLEGDGLAKSFVGDEAGGGD